MGKYFMFLIFNVLSFVRLLGITKSRLSGQSIMSDCIGF